MNLKKQQLIAISLAFCCAAVMPLQAEARKKENKTNETQPVVSSVPQPRSQKQVLIQNPRPNRGVLQRLINLRYRCVLLRQRRS